MSYKEDQEVRGRVSKHLMQKENLAVGSNMTISRFFEDSGKPKGEGNYIELNPSNL